MRELVFLLEERSARAMLEGLIPRLGVRLPAIRYVVFEGKSDLDKHLGRRLRGYLNPEAHFFVIRDQDADPDCRAVKARLTRACRDAGQSEVTVRIMCRELEALYADLQAVERAFGLRGLAARQGETQFRTPDAIASPSRKLAELTKGRYQKIGGSRLLGQLLDTESTRSSSFRVLVTGLRRLGETDQSDT